MIEPMLDTSPESQRKYYALLRAAGVAGRSRALWSACSGLRGTVLAGIRHRHPGISEDELRGRLAVRLYGRAVAERLFGPLPDDAR
ncbi:MAG: hypothetical protein ACYCWW_13705 [Deltaproteobacteria bacterium]